MATGQTLILVKQRTVSLMQKSIEVEKNNTEKETITFTADAKSLWKCYAQQIESDMNSDQVFEHYTDHASKLMDNISRIAGLIHYFEHGTSKAIDTKTLTYAYHIGMLSSGHFLKYLGGIPRVVILAESIVDLLIKKARAEHKINSIQYPNAVSQNLDTHTTQDAQGYSIRIRKPYTCQFIKSDICQSKLNVFRDEMNFFRAVHLLIRMGHVTEETKPRGIQGYNFSETLHSKFSPDHLPEIKNGHQLHVRNLPQIFNQCYLDQDSNNPDQKNKPLGRYQNTINYIWWLVLDLYDD